MRESCRNGQSPREPRVHRSTALGKRPTRCGLSRQRSSVLRPIDRKSARNDEGRASPFPDLLLYRRRATVARWFMFPPFHGRSGANRQSRMSVIPLQVDPTDSEKFSNITAYVNSLFTSDVRRESVITTAMTSGETHCGTPTRTAPRSFWAPGWPSGSTARAIQDHRIRPRRPQALPLHRRRPHRLPGQLHQAARPADGQAHLTPTSSYITDGEGNQLRVYKTTGWQVKHFITDGKWNYGEIANSNPVQYSAGSGRPTTPW